MGAPFDVCVALRAAVVEALARVLAVAITEGRIPGAAEDVQSVSRAMAGQLRKAFTRDAVAAELAAAVQAALVRAPGETHAPVSKPLADVFAAVDRAASTSRMAFVDHVARQVEILEAEARRLGVEVP